MYKFTTPKQLNDYLNTFDYGILYKNKKIKNPNCNDFKKYRTLEPLTFFKYKIGVCWDYTAAEYFYFKNNFNYKCETIYIEIFDKLSSSHTFLLYYDKGYCYYFESCYEKYKGIHKFKNKKEAINFVLNNMLKKNNNFKYIINEYCINEYGLKTLEFMDIVTKQTLRGIENEKIN